ncbi:MAG: glycoside hydrolase family 15 protein [Desulfotomaculales bacterium]
MPRPVVLGNGSILVAFDRNMVMRDFYYPYVGQWNHIMGNKNNVGFWTEGRFAWLDSPGWERSLGYLQDSLVARCRAEHRELSLALESLDAVHFRDNIYLKRLRVKNLSGREREVRVFFTQDFSIDETEVGDTALYDPQLHTVYHYKKNRYFMVDGYCGTERFFQFATGTKRFAGAEGTWRDAEDGVLSGNPIAQGSVDSTISFRFLLGAGEAKDVFYWVVAGRNFQEVRHLDGQVWNSGAADLLEKICAYWRSWLARSRLNFADLPESVARLYNLSLLMIRAHLDRNGAFIAAADSDIMETNRDHYCYLWPRDGALAACALIRAGYGELAKSFFAFCANALTEGGYLLHKYNPDGTVGSSWHPWLDAKTLPIQEDETALVLYAFGKYYAFLGDLETAAGYFRTLVKPAADFLAAHFHPGLGLPRESYDLWEERRGIFTFTAAAVVAGLKAAALLAGLLSEKESAALYRERAGQIEEGIAAHLYDPVLGRFVRGLVQDGEGDYHKDPVLESSVLGLFFLGVLPADDPRLAETAAKIEEGLWVKTPVGGLARYAGDYYFRRSPDSERVPGNPWIICTLWLAQWYAARAADLAGLAPAKALLHWAAAYALESGALPEQLHPESGEPLSVAPLVWSHAAFVLAVRDYLERYALLTREPCPGRPGSDQPAVLS